MRISLFLILVSTLQIVAGNIYSQTTRLTLGMKNVSIKDVLSQIEEQTHFYFLYDNGLIDVQKKVDVVVQNEPVDVILDKLFGEGKVISVIRDRHIILTPADKAVIQQQLKVSGRVTDSSGAPMPGVTVLLRGTIHGTITNGNGNYFLSNIPEDGTLVFSFVGMKTREIATVGQSVINVVLEEEAIGIEEVVAVGYGTMKKRDLTGAVGSVNSGQIIWMNPVQLAKALQGQVAGVNVSKVNSRPGASYNIDIRGLHSINYSSEPLVVIDGVMGGSLNSLNPSDISSIDILKDASATAIYGSRGANGVIIVTTKKGELGKPKVTYDGYVGIKLPAYMPDMMTAQEFYHAYNDVILAEVPNSSPFWTATELANVNAGRSVNWVDLITEPALQTSHALALSGGNENTTHYFSTGYLNEKGNLINTGYERYNLKGSIDSKLNNVVKVGFTSYFTFSILNLGSGEALRSAYRIRPTGSVYYADLVNPSETNDRDVDGYAFWMGIKDTQTENPILEIRRDYYQDETRVSSFLGNGYIELAPLKGLSFKSSLSASVFNSRRGIFEGANSKGRLNKLPKVRNYNNLNGSYTLDNILTYKLNAGSHDFNFTAVQSALYQRFETSTIQVENLPYNSYWYALNTAAIINQVTSSLVERQILSFMGRINYSFKKNYLLTLTGRSDGSSVLAPGHKWAFFPSVAFAWRANEETFIKDMNAFSDLKLRLSYGNVGNDVVSPYSTQASLIRTAYDFDGVAAYGYTPVGIGNENLKWEKSSEINVGLNIGFLKNRLSADIEFYNRKTKDLIQRIQLPPSVGFASVTSNVGKILNQGVEITLNTVNIQMRNFNWNTVINFSSNHNEILRLYGGTVDKDIANKLFVGESLRSNFYYKFDGIWQDAIEAAVYNQVPGSVKVVDQNRDNKISSAENEDDRVVLGSELPKWIGGITNTFTYKNWDLSCFVYTRQGVQYRNAMLQGTMGELGSGRYNRLNLNYWTKTNPTNDYFGLWQPNPYREAIQYQDASFWRISNITLGYNLPKNVLNRLKADKIRCYLQANNLAVFTKFDSLDPEFNSGTSGDDIPSATYIFGVNVSF
ncbi:MAG: SusC/RagA family TonB-linked outer membrane protein [Mangrovibacterium sp.]